VAVLIFAATTSADPKSQSSYKPVPDAETLDNYNEVNGEKDFCQSVSFARTIYLHYKIWPL
jgi:hypothetical protein